eukprot:TRINITY_DN41959_c0_g1_i1.p1 TRINITY_DN41959_c0_g1~~TRINITY_DN41959_c0_g1_i1.p1  ORF type:complete len:696 (-),score=99.90 TRINITY_DN41959_c0_g1_i1:40-2127(-)
MPWCSRAAQCFEKLGGWRSTPADGDGSRSRALLQTEMEVQTSPTQPGATSHPSHPLDQPEVRGRRESAEWLNEMVKCSWKYIEETGKAHLQKQLTLENIEYLLEKENVPLPVKGLLKGEITITHFELGNNPPTISDIDTEQTERGIKLRGRLMFDSDVKIELQTARVGTWGIQKLKMRGELIVCIEPLLGRLPIFGAASLYFLNQPIIEPMVSSRIPLVADALNYFLPSVIAKQVARKVVLPNMETINLAKDKDLHTALLTMHPAGVLRITIMSACDLLAADTYFTQQPSSDPYVIVQVGADQWRSSTMDKTLNPIWNPPECRDFVVYDLQQHISIQVWDEDQMKYDDILGYTRQRSVEDAIQDSGLIIWERLYDQDDGNCQKGQGQIQLRVQWFELGDIASTLSPGSASSSSSQSSYIARFSFGKLSSADFHKVSLAVTLEDRGEKKEVKACKKKVFAISHHAKKLQPLVKRMGEDRHNLTLQNISDITGLDVEDVMDMLDREKSLTPRLQENRERSPFPSALHHTLYMAITSDSITAETTFEVEFESKFQCSTHRGRTAQKMKPWLDRQPTCRTKTQDDDMYEDCEIKFDSAHPPVILKLAVTFLELQGTRRRVGFDEPPRLDRYHSPADDLRSIMSSPELLSAVAATEESSSSDGIARSKSESMMLRQSVGRVAKGLVHGIRNRIKKASSEA